MARDRQKKRRRGRLPWLLAAICLLAGFLWWSNQSLMVERFEFLSGALPQSFDGTEIALVSDLHGKRFGAENRRFLDLLRAEAPDYIAVTGDLVDEHTDDPAAYAAQTGGVLAALAPTYFVTGNHEWAARWAEELCGILEQAGVRCLRNETVPLEREGERILLSGIDDPNAYADQKSPAQVAEDLKKTYGDGDFRILLAHRNDRFAAEYSLLGYDLTLSGHGHGGLIRLPFTDGLFGTDHRTLFPSYTSGLYEANGASVLISRGLGNIVPTFRLFNRPVLVMVTLRRG